MKIPFFHELPTLLLALQLNLVDLLLKLMVEIWNCSSKTVVTTSGLTSIHVDKTKLTPKSTITSVIDKRNTGGI